MSFTPGIPANGQSLGSSRTQVLNNFASLRSTLAANHVDVNSANPGLHTHADFLAQSADPNPATGIVSHYSKVVTGVTQWFFQRENTGPIIQMSNGNPSIMSTFPNSKGQSFLPGGFILQWGFLVVPGNGSGFDTVNLNTTFPTAPLTAWATSQAAQPNASTVNQMTTTTLTITWGDTTGVAPYNILWFAIGN